MKPAQRCAGVDCCAALRRSEHPVWRQLRAGKRECVWSAALPAIEVSNRQGVKTQRALRRIYRLTERTIDQGGNALWWPEYVLEGWTTTLGPQVCEEQLIALYRAHATHEQFHAEFKTDMALQRLPSGKFATNPLVCALAAVAMNLLRIIGQHTLHDADSPMRKAALRRRIKTVMQEMMCKAMRIIGHARRWVLGISGTDAGFAVFARAHAKRRAA